ncbi:MAG TPA: biopolymer transporter ExbD [Pyrinomonadaceae bacterium]|nr:biopolymer transporter ExbD [Pyrinomonadaceae bacterium]
MSNHAERSSGGENYARPNINVTPLIDVLLVMLIIFMVVSPLRPARFLTKTASKPDDQKLNPNDKSLTVTIRPDRSLMLNRESDMGTVYDSAKLITRLHDVFEQRFQNRVYRDELRDRNDLPDSVRIERTVFIKAPRMLSYADVARVLDAIKGAGAMPVGLQIDNLD